MQQDHNPTTSKAEWTSALFDDACSLSDEQIKSLTRDPEVAARYAEYAIISDALHPGGSQHVTQAFQLKVMQAIAQEPVHFLPAHQRQVRQRRRLVSAIAAGVGAVGFVSAAYFVALPGLDAIDTPVAMQGPSQSPSQPVVQTVRVQSPWQDPQARKFIDAHGPTVVKMRLESEQP